MLPPPMRARGVTAVLGPTNTGKTHLAIERMLGHGAGLIGLPLRLLAREVYNKIVERVGAEKVALVTGEEKIKPDNARYWVATAEAMPRDLDLPFVALDEIQIAADLERGHVFTERLLNRRGSAETLLLGAATMRPIVEKLIPGVNVVSRPRLSNLLFAGEKKLTRLPRRTAIVAFSSEEVYAIAELIRRQRGGAAVVLGALSPRTRNAQVAMYQNGDVDYMVATDAIGMGLNLDVDHVAFAGDRKFDGYQFRRLTPGEFGQIAGRAGRHVRDGTFGTTGRCDGFEQDLVEAIESHSFDSVKVLQWRNPSLDFSTVASLQESLGRAPDEAGLTRAPDADDIRALSIAARDEKIRAMAHGAAAVERLWEMAQVPDYRKISPHAHADLVTSLYGFLMRDGKVPDDWFARQVAFSDRTDGDIDTLSTRIAHIRTWTFAANRPDWLKDPAHWQGVTRAVEDKLSDALHERLAQRFVDRRTSVLMRRLRENVMLETEITKTGDVIVEGQHVGTLQGFQFAPDPSAGDGESGRALRAAAAKALAGEIEARSQKFSQAPDTEFALAIDGTIRWVGEPVAKLAGSDKTLAPRIRLLADEQLTGPARDAVQTRLEIWIGNHMARLLGPLLLLDKAEDLQGLAKGIAFQLVEALGVLDRSRVAEDLKQLDQDQRASLRKHGVRFGAYHIYLPALMKPAPRTLAVQLWALNHGGLEQKGLDEIPHLAASGRTSIPADHGIDKTLYRLIGYRVCGERAVRVDILERLADIIRPAIAYRPGVTVGEPPAGTADGDAFVATVQMTSLVGCSGEDFASILRGLGYRSEKRKGQAITQPIRLPAPTVPVTPMVAAPEAAAPVEAPAAGEEDALPAEATEGAETAEAPADATAPEAAELPVETEAETAVEVEAEIAAEAEGESPAAPAELPATDAVESVAEAEPEAPAPVAEAQPAEPAPAADANVAVSAAEPAETPSEATVAPEAVAAPEEPAEPVLESPAEPVPDVEIEIWRPVRFDRHQRPQHGRGAAGERRERFHNRPQGQRPDGRFQGERPQGERPQGERPQGERPQGERQGERQQAERGPGDRLQAERPAGARRGLAAAAASDIAARPEERRDDERGRRFDRQRDRQGAERRDGGAGREEKRPPETRNGKQGGRPDWNRDDRGPRRDRERDQDRAPRNWSTEPRPSRENRQPDPNSPFAKLLALKEQMQKSGKES
ncbi:ATP-dependent RNA helicase SUPV3L1/SUV3 [Labrys wisconsinensis]|uniref:ATP-dependent RNA helicase SUPV3L1/SUV3 n=1 Tax=Labrys wisconsinensis TaxID=425677 RepID=A0ABU0JM61_9HYPH|nr:ATP-dependent RNA helicase SUPV3L1/SUV3 [Labrys wisconsinensis]